MGILHSPPSSTMHSTAKRKSGTIDFSAIKPLQSSSNVANFAGYRDAKVSKSVLKKLSRKQDDVDADSDDDETGPVIMVEDEDKETGERIELTPEEAARQEELTEGVKKVNLVRTVSLMI